MRSTEPLPHASAAFLASPDCLNCTIVSVAADSESHAAPTPSSRLRSGVGTSADWNWVAGTLSSLGAPGIDVILLSRDQRVLLGPPDLVEKPLTVRAATAAGRGDGTVVTRERWPDGDEYLTVSVPMTSNPDMPSFDWSLLVRENVASALVPTQQLIQTFWT